MCGLETRGDGVRRAGGVALAALAALALAASTAQAVNVRALAIIAKNEGSGMDSRIPPAIQEALKRNFNYKRYDLGGKDSADVALGQTATLSLAGPYSLRVKPVKVDPDDQSVLLEWEILRSGDRVGGASMWLKPDRYGLVGGPAINGGTLIIALAVR